MPNYGTKKLEPVKTFIAANWREMSDAELALAVDSSRTNVRKLRQRMGFKRDEENRAALWDKAPKIAGWNANSRGYMETQK